MLLRLGNDSSPARGACSTLVDGLGLLDELAAKISKDDVESHKFAEDEVVKYDRGDGEGRVSQSFMVVARVVSRPHVTM